MCPFFVACVLGLSDRFDFLPYAFAKCFCLMFLPDVFAQCFRSDINRGEKPFFCHSGDVRR